MIRYPRPEKPDGFPSGAIQAAERALADAAGAAPMPDHWKEYKHHFYRAQHGKCGFCEAPILGDVGAVEHRHPKAEVTELVTPGAERPHGTNVKGRICRVIVGVGGYWWLAYDWNNWLLACNRCNSAWKQNLYPLDLPPGVAHPPLTPGVVVNALLLDPYGDVNPLDHLDFHDTGVAVPRDDSARGRATITVCGLHRESLRREREQVASRVNKLVDTYLSLIQEGDDIAGALLHQAYDQAEKDQAFAGVVRCILHARLGLPLSDLDL